VKRNGTEVYNQQLSHSGKLLLVEGDFTKVGGLGRQQIFMLHVNQTPAKVTGWSSPEFDGSKGEIHRRHRDPHVELERHLPDARSV
jgi:hypothetical protein